MGYDQWDQSSAGLDSAHPGPIDNSSLFKGTCDELYNSLAKYYYTITHTFFIDCANGTLKDHRMEELDYSLLPEPAWLKMRAWFGLSEDSQPIPRCVQFQSFLLPQIT